MHAAEQIFLLLAQGFAAVLGAELERRVGLGHKAGHADRHLYALALRAVGDFVEEIHDLLGGIGNTLDIVQCFGGQAHHKVELDRGVPFREGNAAAALDLLPGDVFVDNVAQALGAGFGGKGQAAFAYFRRFLDQRFREIVHAQ